MTPALLEIARLNAGYGEMQVLRGVSLVVRPAEIVAMVGGNGAGKTTLLRAVLGELQPAEGEIVLGRRVKVGYLDQQRKSLDGDLSVYECVAQAVPSTGNDRVDPAVDRGRDDLDAGGA